jgi:hypothetical protein
MRRPECARAGANAHPAWSNRSTLFVTARIGPAPLRRFFVADKPQSPVPIFCVNTLLNNIFEPTTQDDCSLKKYAL